MIHTDNNTYFTENACIWKSHGGKTRGFSNNFCYDSWKIAFCCPRPVDYIHMNITFSVGNYWMLNKHRSFRILRKSFFFPSFSSVAFTLGDAGNNVKSKNDNVNLHFTWLMEYERFEKMWFWWKIGAWTTHSAKIEFLLGLKYLLRVLCNIPNEMLFYFENR